GGGCAPAARRPRGAAARRGTAGGGLSARPPRGKKNPPPAPPVAIARLRCCAMAVGANATAASATQTQLQSLRNIHPSRICPMECVFCRSLLAAPQGVNPPLGEHIADRLRRPTSVKSGRIPVPPDRKRQTSERVVTRPALPTERPPPSRGRRSPAPCRRCAGDP